MKFRSAFAVLAGLGLMVGGCASTGTGPGAGDPDAPRETEHTRNATLFLSQAQLTGSEEDRQVRYQEALGAAQAGITEDPDHGLSHLLAGQALVGLGRMEEADQALTRAVSLYDGYGPEVEAIREEAWIEAYNAAVDALNEGNQQEALAQFEQAHAIYRDRPEAMLNLGALYAGVGEAGLAIERFGEAEQVILARADEQDEETRGFWLENLEVATFNRAQLLAQEGRFDEAETAYRGFLEREPDNITALSNLAVVLVNKGDTAGAEALYADLLSRPGMTAEDFFVTGIGLFQVEAYDRAAEAFGRAHELNPRSRDAIYNYAQTLYLAEEHERVIEIQDALLEADEYNENVYRLIAQSYLQTGDQQTAVSVLERMEALPFEITDTQLQPLGGGGARILGLITNLGEAQGTPVQVRFTFMGPDGNDLGSTEVTVNLPADEESVEFQGQFQSDERVASYRYEVLSH